MTIPQAQLWKGTPFSITRQVGKASDTVIIRLSGHFTARDMYGSLTPLGLKKCSTSNRLRTSSCRH